MQCTRGWIHYHGTKLSVCHWMQWWLIVASIGVSSNQGVWRRNSPLYPPLILLHYLWSELLQSTSLLVPFAKCCGLDEKLIGRRYMAWVNPDKYENGDASNQIGPIDYYAQYFSLDDSWLWESTTAHLLEIGPRGDQLQWFFLCKFMNQYSLSTLSMMRISKYVTCLWYYGLYDDCPKWSLVERVVWTRSRPD